MKNKGKKAYKDKYKGDKYKDKERKQYTSDEEKQNKLNRPEL